MTTNYKHQYVKLKQLFIDKLSLMLAFLKNGLIKISRTVLSQGSFIQKQYFHPLTANVEYTATWKFDFFMVLPEQYKAGTKKATYPCFFIKAQSTLLKKYQQ